MIFDTTGEIWLEMKTQKNQLIKLVYFLIKDSKHTSQYRKIFEKENNFKETASNEFTIM